MRRKNIVRRIEGEIGIMLENLKEKYVFFDLDGTLS